MKEYLSTLGSLILLALIIAFIGFLAVGWAIAIGFSMHGPWGGLVWIIWGVGWFLFIPWLINDVTGG